MENNGLRFEKFLCDLFQGHQVEVNGSIGNGERVVLRGPSGCGKTSLLKFIAGLYPSTSGSLWLDQDNITRSEPTHSRPGLVFQGGALFEHLSVFENCKIALDYSPKSSAWSQELKAKAINEKLSEVGLGEKAPQLAQQLSGGEKQRVALVRCLLSSPRFLLLDEPLSALDPDSRLGLQQMLLNLLAKNPLPTLIVTHDETEAKVLGTRVVAWPSSRSAPLTLHF